MIQSTMKIGNDAPELKTEMKQILDKLYDKGVFSHQFYTQFKKCLISTIICSGGLSKNLYLTNNTTGANYYFISVAANPSSYDIQFTMQPYKAVSGYTAAAGALAFSTSGYTPQIQIIDSGNNSFSSIVGLSQGTYPPAQQATLYSVLSDLVPQIDPVSSVIVGVSNLQNPLASNNQVLHSFTSAGVGFGGLITTSQGQGISYCPMQGITNELLVSFYDDRMLPLKITDPNLCVRLLIRPRKIDIMDF
ncbi:unnamed protein product [Phytophthora lilii]|uniref:Unnamed protein product n=1 Tax=Phytophthora lilii TaxID=2077276 RepID=A0A9W6XFQ8_9STRA|nr:unnamed protein product [Phytophthora lilii]